MLLLERKLAALGFPDGATVNSEDDVDLWALVLWLDDKILHRLSGEHRRALVEGVATEPRNWTVLNEGFARDATQYAGALGQPHTLPDSRTAWLEWLAGYALAVAAADDGTLLFPGREMHSANNVAGLGPSALATLDDVCRLLDVSTASGVDAAVQALEHLILTSGVNHFELARAHVRALAKGTVAVAEPTSDFPLGFNTNDAVVNQLAVILRMLYVADLRDLQTSGNEIIAACQTLARSALDDPRANVKLGRARHGR